MYVNFGKLVSVDCESAKKDLTTNKTQRGMLAQLVERALSMCKVRSSTLLHSTTFFLSGVLRVLRGRGCAKNNNAFDDDRIYLFL